MQNVTVQFQKYPPTQGHFSRPYCSVFLLSDHHTARGLRGRKRHKIQYQLRQSLVAETAIQPEEQELNGTLCLKWSSICRVTLQFRVSIGLVYKSL